MPAPDNDRTQKALAREWAAARIVVIGGFVVAIAVAGYFWYRDRQAAIAEEQLSAPHAVSIPKKVDPKLLERVELAVCTEELIRAKALGIVPAYGTLATDRLVAGNAPRRYICEAKTHLTKYFIAADLLCDNIADAKCVSVYRIATKNGELVYARTE